MAYERQQGGHEVAQASRPDYRLEIGRAEVPVGQARDFSVLEPARAKTLKAWVATLIPASGSRPNASEVGAAEYIDATVLMAPGLRPVLLQAIDQLEVIATTRARRGFPECTATERQLLLRELEASHHSDAFSMVRDFTYEAYYGHPKVLAALEADTGWSSTSPTRGSSMKPFDPTRLDRVRSLPPHWRKP